MPAATITRSVTEKVQEAKPGTVFFPADLLEFGAPDAIHQTFSRLARTKILLRLAKGTEAGSGARTPPTFARRCGSADRRTR